MAKSVNQLFKDEQRDPWKIRRWLRYQGYRGKIIDIALAEHAQKLANGVHYGYSNGISLLTLSVKDRVQKLAMMREEAISIELGKFKKENPWYKKKLW